MKPHIKVLGVLNIVWGATGALAGVIVLLVFGGISGVLGTVSHETPGAGIAIPIMGIIGGAISLLLLIISVPSIIAGIGLLRFRPWGRLLGIIVSVLHLLNIPIGTALGIYGLWVLLSEGGERCFRDQVLEI